MDHGRRSRRFWMRHWRLPVGDSSTEQHSHRSPYPRCAESIQPKRASVIPLPHKSLDKKPCAHLPHLRFTLDSIAGLALATCTLRIYLPTERQTARSTFANGPGRAATIGQPVQRRARRSVGTAPRCYGSTSRRSLSNASVSARLSPSRPACAASITL